MEEKFDQIEVYVKINENGEIIKIGSSIFINDKKDWIIIDEGMGDKYAHAQSQYFDKPLQNENGEFNYIYRNGKVEEVCKSE